MRILDTEHPFFQPLWVRVAIVILAFTWAAFEFAMGEDLWALIFGAIGSFYTWALLINYRNSHEKGGRDG